MVVSCLLVFSSSINVNTLLNGSYELFGMLMVGPLIALPTLDVIKNMFSSSQLTFDNMMGNVVVSMTLVPGLIGLFMPLPLSAFGKFNIMPLVMLNTVCLSFAMLTRMRTNLHRKTGLVLIAAFVFFIAYSIFG
jgi:Ca2+/Na+ antiporter